MLLFWPSRFCTCNYQILNLPSLTITSVLNLRIQRKQTKEKIAKDLVAATLKNKWAADELKAEESYGCHQDVGCGSTKHRNLRKDPGYQLKELCE